jgi:23S rRNA pseudoU1915 N3-methylase RlmH
MGRIIKVDEFADLVHDLLKSDRDVNMAVGGMTGEGKSTFSASSESLC